jgi:hypothetical protein
VADSRNGDLDEGVLLGRVTGRAGCPQRLDTLLEETSTSLRLPARISDMQTDQSGDEDSQVEMSEDRLQHDGRACGAGDRQDISIPHGGQGHEAEIRQEIRRPSPYGAMPGAGFWPPGKKTGGPPFRLGTVMGGCVRRPSGALSA